MKNSTILLIIAAVALVWAYMTGRLNKLFAGKADEPKGNPGANEKQTDGSISTNTGSQSIITSNVTTNTNNQDPGPANITRFVPTRVGKTLRQTVASKGGQTQTIPANTQLLIYGSDGRTPQGLSTSKGLIPATDIKFTGVLSNDVTTAGGSSSTSDFRTRVKTKSSFQR